MKYACAMHRCVRDSGLNLALCRSVAAGDFEVNNGSDKIVQGDKEHSELEVRGEPGLQS